MLVRHLVPRLWLQGSEAALGRRRGHDGNRDLPGSGGRAAHDRGAAARRKFAVLSGPARSEPESKMPLEPTEPPSQPPSQPIEEPHPDDQPAEPPPPEETPVRDPGPRRAPAEEPPARDPAPPRAPVEEPPGRTRHT